jgi:hypothetical protein
MIFLCSRNARPQKALVGRAQWKINQPPSLRDNERAWGEYVYRSMRAVKGSLGHSPCVWYGEEIELDMCCRKRERLWGR